MEFSATLGFMTFNLPAWHTYLDQHSSSLLLVYPGLLSILGLSYPITWYADMDFKQINQQDSMFCI